jgi:hypothetical protein
MSIETLSFFKVTFITTFVYFAKTNSVRKISLFLFLLVLVAVKGDIQAQVIKPSFTLGFGAAFAQPMDHLKEGFKYGVGGDVYGGVGWGKTYLVATAGYRAFLEDVQFDAKALSYVPVKLGIRQYVFSRRLYIQGNAGMASVGYRNETETAFTYDIGGGIRLAGFEIAAFFDAFKPKNATVYSTSVNGRIGYSFSL